MGKIPPQSDKHCFECSNSYKKREMEKEASWPCSARSVHIRAVRALQREGNGTNYPSRDATDSDMPSTVKPSPLRPELSSAKVSVVSGVT